MLVKKILTLLPLALFAGACGSSHSVTLGSGPATTTSTTAPKTATTVVTVSPLVTTTVPTDSGESLSSTASDFLTAMFDNNAADTCGYAVPSQVSTCDAVMSGATYQAAHIRLGRTAIDGNRAIVVQLGTICVAQVCLTNVNPGAGLPESPASFDDVFSNTQTGSPDADHAFVYNDGRWWAEF